MQEMVEIGEVDHFAENPLARLQMQMARNAQELNMILDPVNHPEPEFYPEPGNQGNQFEPDSDPEQASSGEDDDNDEFGFEVRIIAEESFIVANPPPSSSILT